MAEDYIALARKAAEQEGVDPDLFVRQIKQESGYNPKAVSPKGAIGLAQLMPGTAKDLGVDPHDPWQNLVGGARYLSRNIKQFGSVELGLAAYNAGPGNVQKHGGVPPFAETQNYIKIITGQAPTAAPSRAGAGRGVTGTVAERVAPIVNTDAVFSADRIAPSAGSFTPNLETENFRQQIAAESEPSLLAVIGAAFAGNTSARIVNGAKGILFTPAFKDEPDFTPNVDIPAAQTDYDLWKDLKSSRSQAEYNSILDKHTEDTTRTKALFSRGMLPGLALGLATEVADLSNVIPGVAVHKAMVASQLARGGIQLTQAQTIMREVGGNLVSGTAVEGFAQAMERKFSPTDLFVAAAFDTGIGATAGHFSAKAASKLMAEHTQQVAHLEAEAVRYAQARKTLGADAGDEAVAAEMQRLHAAELAAPVVANSSAPVPRHRQFLESPDDVAARAAEPSQDIGGMSAPTAQTNAPKVIPAGAGEWRFKNPGELATWRKEFDVGGKHEPEIALRTGGVVKTLADFEKLTPGVHPVEGLAPEARQALVAADKLVAKFLGPDFKLTVHTADLADAAGKTFRGDALQVSASAAMIRVNKNMDPLNMLRTTVHEIGHVILNKHLSNLDDAMLNKMHDAYKRFQVSWASNVDGGLDARSQRFSLLNSELYPDIPSGNGPGAPVEATKYGVSRDEFHAEQFVKYFEEDQRGGNKIGLPEQLRAAIKTAIVKVLEFLRLAKRADLGVTDEFREVFDVIAAGLNSKTADAVPTTGAMGQADQATTQANRLLADPYAIKIGANLLPVGTDLERGVVDAAVRMHKMADEWAVQFPKDAAWDARAKNLADNNVFNVASIGLTMLKSESNLVRMLASELLEDASGVAGKRNATASIAKYIAERKILGNAINDFESAHKAWAKRQEGRPVYDEVWGGKFRDKFNREVMAEREARANGTTISRDEDVLHAADSLDAAYTRAAHEQISNKTLGWASLPQNSRGYTPHQMSAKAILNLTNEQRGILQSALTDQYITISGWDMSFADGLAATVVERMRKRASGGYVHPTGGTGSGSAEVVRDALQSMGMSADEVRRHMDKFTKGAASHTKKRIQLDLNKEYDTPNGPFKLLDVFETDQVTLLRSQTQRVSGEVALARHGIYGKPHLELIRKVLEDTGEDGKKATVKELEAFDQMVAEFLGAPFGKEMGKFMEGATQANTLVKLGGAVYNQIAEFVNGVFHVGAARTMDSVLSIGRLRGEIIDLAKGKKVDNPWLNSIELDGAEFGTDAYKVVLPYDNPNHMLPAYGNDSPSVVNRILRAGTHYQGILSGWRMIHSAQQRGMAEQIVKKAIRYINEGKSDAALRGFGITEEVQKAIKADMSKVASFNGSTVTGIDVTKITDPNIREQFIHAIHRGTMQIIQGTFLGERGAWAHDGWMRALTQFRSFSIVSMEKQWGRQRNTHGTAKAFGMMMGAMSMAAPIYMARVYAQSVGREDQQEYIDKMLQPELIARATLNYIAMSGMAGDFIDASSSLLPAEYDIRPTGGRAGQPTGFVGSYVLPATGVVDDFYKAMQNPDEPDSWRRVLPMGNLPWLLPMVNGLRH